MTTGRRILFYSVSRSQSVGLWVCPSVAQNGVSDLLYVNTKMFKFRGTVSSVCHLLCIALQQQRGEVVLFSVVSVSLCVCLSVCLSIEPLEILSSIFMGARHGRKLEFACIAMQCDTQVVITRSAAKMHVPVGTTFAL